MTKSGVALVRGNAHKKEQDNTTFIIKAFALTVASQWCGVLNTVCHALTGVEARSDGVRTTAIGRVGSSKLMAISIIGSGMNPVVPVAPTRPSTIWFGSRPKGNRCRMVGLSIISTASMTTTARRIWLGCHANFITNARAKHSTLTRSVFACLKRNFADSATGKNQKELKVTPRHILVASRPGCASLCPQGVGN